MATTSPSPRLRGLGVRGNLSRFTHADTPPHPDPRGSDLSPQAGRGSLFLSLRPFVEHALGLAERSLQSVGRHRFDAGVDAGGVLDMRGEKFGMLEETAAIPAFRPRFRQ